MPDLLTTCLIGFYFTKGLSANVSLQESSSLIRMRNSALGKSAPHLSICLVCPHLAYRL